jgi:hypothetical protein
MLSLALFAIGFESMLMVLTDLFSDPNNIIDALVGISLIITALWQLRNWTINQQKKGYCVLIARFTEQELVNKDLLDQIHKLALSHSKIEGILMHVLRRGNVGVEEFFK